MFDIVFAQSEKEKKEFWKKAQELGFNGLIFIEDFGQNTGAEAVLIKTDNANELKKQILASKKKYDIIAVLGSNDEINRIAAESQISILLNPEHSRKQDFMHYRNSGLNQVVCNLVAKNNISIAINFSEFSAIKSNKEKAQVLGRIMQNAKLCRKFKAKMLIASFAKSPDKMASISELKNFALSAGMSNSQAKEAFESLKKKAI